MPRAFAAKRRNGRAVIVGGSMSGLFTAAFLRQIDWDADVYERSTVELVGRGAGITTHPELLEALQNSGAGTLDLGVEVEKRITLDRGGRVIGEKSLPQILTSWDRLQRLLRETIDEAHYHLGHTFERVEQNNSGVIVHFAGGRSERADILIGGDGIRSSVRAQVAPGRHATLTLVPSRNVARRRGNARSAGDAKELARRRHPNGLLRRAIQHDYASERSGLTMT